MHPRDAFDYPQDYRRWVAEGEPDPLHDLDDVIREFLPDGFGEWPEGVDEWAREVKR